MKSFAALALMLGVMTNLGGCATLSENECRGADWESIGYRDGNRGYDAGRVVNHADACSEYGIAPDRSQYEAGRQRGLELFCTARNGVQLGRQGSSYGGVCPASLEQDFLQGYDLGRRIYDLDQHLSRLRSDIDHVQANLQQTEPPLKESERDQLLYRLRELEREYGRSESDLRRLEMHAHDY